MKSCLIVDDSKVVRKVARRILEELGFQCTEAEDGQQALDACKQTTPEIILLDWNMPVMSGIEFLVAFRAMPTASATHVIFCTTENDMSKIMEAMQKGANEYIMKPFDREIIESKLMQVGLL